MMVARRPTRRESLESLSRDFAVVTAARGPPRLSGDVLAGISGRRHLRSRPNSVIGRRPNENPISCPSTPKALRPRTPSGELPVPIRKERIAPAQRPLVQSPDVCLSAPPPSRASTTRGRRRVRDVTSAPVLPANIRYDPDVVGEVGPDASKVPKRSVHLQQQLRVKDEEILGQLMASFQVRPISSAMSKHEAECQMETASFDYKRAPSLSREKTWPRIRVSSASSNSSRTMKRAGFFKSRDSGRPGNVSRQGSLDQEEGYSTEGEDAGDELAYVSVPTSIYTQKVVLTEKPPRSEPRSTPEANQTRSYDLRKSGSRRQPLPVCKIGLLEKRAKGSILRQPRAQSLSPYLPNYRSGGKDNTTHVSFTEKESDLRPFSSADAPSRKVTFNEVRCASSSDAIRPGNIPESGDRKERPISTALRKFDFRRTPPKEKRSVPRPKSDRHERPQGTLYAKISVADLDMPQPSSGTSWLRAYQRKELIFYTAVLRDEEKYIAALTARRELEGVAVKTLSVGSLVVQLQCAGLDDVKRLEKLYRRKTLGAIFNEVLVTGELMKEMAVQNMVLEANIEKADFERCKRELNILEIQKTIEMEEKLNLEEKRVEERQFMSRVECVKTYCDVLDDYKSHLTTLRQRHERISRHQKEFLMTLKLAKPVHVKQFQALNDVIAVHRYLRASPSVGKTVQTDLVTDFLSIVNLSRLKLSDLLNKVKTIEKHVLKYADRSLPDLIYRSVEQATRVLDPEFSLDDVTHDDSVTLGIMDTKMFGALVYYVPFLFGRLHDVRDVMIHLIKSLSLSNQPGIRLEEEADEQNKCRKTTCKSKGRSTKTSGLNDEMMKVVESSGDEGSSSIETGSEKQPCPCSYEFISKDVVNIPS